MTGEDLVAALRYIQMLQTCSKHANVSHRGCLSASPLLGPLGIPLFIEKLNAGTPATKVSASLNLILIYESFL